MPPTTPLLSTAEVARQLNVSVPTVARWAASGRLRVAAKAPGLRGAFLFRQSDVARLAKKVAA